MCEVINSSSAKGDGYTVVYVADVDRLQININSNKDGRYFPLHVASGLWPVSKKRIVRK